ncbi:hypothetical protein ILYODFUR_009776 [Ilyodon furcidens]|uniref:Uncharacterized protein n=1 Tax=Ilyodon furcidens TaxID=33524 RepID=A0ABV0URN2_9TELE
MLTSTLPSIIFHTLIRGTSFHQGFLSPPLWIRISLSLSVCLSFSGGYFFLSAFYSKSNRKAFIQLKSRESGYMWPALSGEMLHQSRRGRGRCTDGGRRDASRSEAEE